MSVESPLTNPSELADTAQRLEANLQSIQRELDQALGVWRSALSSEKLEFETHLQAREAAWSLHQKGWLEQRAQYEQRIQQLEDQFRAQLEETEQNALRALNELDASWQRQKVEIERTASGRVEEVQARERERLAELNKQEDVIETLRAQITHWESTAKSLELDNAELKARLARTEQSLTEAESRPEPARVALETQLREIWELHHEEQRQAWDAERRQLQAQIDEVRQQATDTAERQTRETLEAASAQRSALEAQIESLKAQTAADAAAHAESANASLREARDVWEREAQDKLQAEIERRETLEREFTERQHNVQTEWAARIQQETSTREALQAHVRQLEAQLTVLREREPRLIAQAVAEAEKAFHQRAAAQLSGEQQARAQAEQRLQEALAHVQVEVRARQAAVDAASEEVRRSWERDKQTWQQSLWQSIQESNEREAALARERENHRIYAERVQREFDALRSKMTTAEQQQSLSKQFLENYLTALESEISMLTDIVVQFKPSLSRFRRKTDLVQISTDRSAFR